MPKVRYFGPFPNGYAVRETLALLQKIFPIRQCENSVYRNRSRPCLQYQIGRCLGPCVEGLVSEEEYAQQVEYVRLFLSGKDDQVLTQLISRMETASQNLEFEEAARIRDQIQAVRRVTEKQFVSNTGDDLDVIGVAFDAGMACVHVLFIRQGKVPQPQLFPESAWRYGTERGGRNLRRPVRITRQPDAQMANRANSCSILILAIKRCSPIPFQNWRDARLMFKPNLAAIGRVI